MANDQCDRKWPKLVTLNDQSDQGDQSDHGLLQGSDLTIHRTHQYHARRGQKDSYLAEVILLSISLIQTKFTFSLSLSWSHLHLALLSNFTLVSYIFVICQHNTWCYGVQRDMENIIMKFEILEF